MSRSIMSRLGAAALGAVLAVTGLAAPAQAIDTGGVTGQLGDGAVPTPFASVVLYGDDVDHFDWTTTDADGRYSFATVPVGHYRVEFSHPDHPTQYAVGKPDWPSADLITVSAGANTVVDDQWLPTGTMTGRLTDRSGAPLADVSVNASGESGGSGYGYTDANGQFSLKVLPGRYRVSFQIGNLTQYAFGKLDWSAADVFDVAAGQTVTVDDTVVATGTVAGRFTDANGIGMPDVEVFLTGGNGHNSWAQTDANGDYTMTDVPVGDYTVQFSSWQDNFQQYAFGAVDSAGAALISVTEGQVSTVNDSRLPTGSVRVTAVDARTGAPISAFGVELSGLGGETANGEVVLPKVPIGTHRVGAYAEGYSSNSDAGTVTVAAGQQAEITVSLQPMSRIQATVVDAATGAPLAGVCVVPVRVLEVRMPDGCGSISRPDGKVTVTVWAGTGTYQLLAWPQEAPGYGAQWVGQNGGTGDLRHAVQLSVVAGETTTAPLIKMDRAGVITGTVFDPDGRPTDHGRVGIARDAVGLGSDFGTVPISTEGQYRFDNLGPYEWPLLFEPFDSAVQWSGGVGNRHQADRISVVVGGTTTYDYRLDAGVAVTVKTTSAFGGFVVALNEDTGDIVGVWWAPDLKQGAIRQVIGGQDVIFQYLPGEGPNGFVGGADFASAASYQVPKRKPATFELTLG